MRDSSWRIVSSRACGGSTLSDRRYCGLVSDPVGADQVRISTREREAAVAALGVHFAAGRLAADEYEERVDVVVEALVRGEVRPVFEDLPLPCPPFLLPMAAAPSVQSGTLPEKLRATLLAEGVLLMDVGLPGSITYRRYRDGEKNFRWRREQLVATVVVTGRRLVVWAAGMRQVDLPFGSPLRAALAVSVEPPGQLLIAYGAAAFSASRSGRVELRIRTSRAADLAELFGSG